LSSVPYPLPFVDFVREFAGDQIFIPSEEPLTLRLNGEWGMKRLYSQNIRIDTTREYTFNFIHKAKLDVKSVFVINNKEFVCRELKYIVNQNGMLPIIEGKFYPVE
jgi:hypothetical protein